MYILYVILFYYIIYIYVLHNLTYNWSDPTHWDERRKIQESSRDFSLACAAYASLEEVPESWWNR